MFIAYRVTETGGGRTKIIARSTRWDGMGVSVIIPTEVLRVFDKQGSQEMTLPSIRAMRWDLT